MEQIYQSRKPGVAPASPAQALLQPRPFESQDALVPVQVPSPLDAGTLPEASSNAPPLQTAATHHSFGNVRVTYADQAGSQAPPTNSLDSGGLGPRFGDSAFGGSAQIVQCFRPRITTPSGLPDPPMPGTIPPENPNLSQDSEGNEIARVESGRWYLSQPPARLNFPLADGYDYRLLPINPNESYDALLYRCQEIEAEQLSVAESLKGDMKYWFAKVYYFVTKFELQKIQNGDYQYPHMKMQEVIQFYNTYKTNLDAWESGQRDRVEANWRNAFAAAESMNGGSWIRTQSLEIMRALLPSMEAHIRFDLPRAIAAVYNLHYSGIPGGSLASFRADFFKMSGVFEQASAALTVEIDADESIFRSFDPTSWDWAQDAGFPFIFHVGLEREMAWEKAEYIERYRGEDRQTADRYMRSAMQTAHPNLEPFEVDDEDVQDFDWYNQPGLRPNPSDPLPVHLPAPAPPPLPEKIYFKYDRPTPDDNLEDAVRSDQDLSPLLELARWLREVRDANLVVEGHASEEGETYYNHNLSGSRAFLIQHFLFHQNADLTNNSVDLVPRGEEGASRTPEWRFASIKITTAGQAKQQTLPANPNLPGEVTVPTGSGQGPGDFPLPASEDSRYG